MESGLEISKVTREDLQAVLRLWEASVRATHLFLTEEDIQFLIPFVEKAIASHELWCTKDVMGSPTAFLCVVDSKIEMLFVHPENRGKGIGRALTEYSISRFNAREVDVNEQNAQAVGFYEKLGFHVVGRSELDPTGKPFPILHMSLKP